ncbi:MAG: HPr(Ser) kinase/phosphatase [Candidatus Cloacimonetes bacterium]|nr:HPr(Ser) kinase/phosphatase [Candidatus Cloacimonadota bacterium]MBS3767015.1 HPr(Ser) kinase/phosphatase [Candidatus Cloacimonadota bacterium]
MKDLTIKTLLSKKKGELQLELQTTEIGLDNMIKTYDMNKPGLAFTGFVEVFKYDRIQLLSKTEIKYLDSLTSTKRYDRIENLFQEFNIPCIIISDGMQPSKELVFLGSENKVPIIVSQLTEEQLFKSLSVFLHDWFAPRKKLNGTLVDVYGVGIFITGKSGIGKSECALELISSGHRFIADDIVDAKRRNNVIMGEANKDIGHFMEIRGIGIIDIERMFGVRSIRVQKRIETQVELVPWRPNMDYERIGLKEHYNRILDVEIPIIYLPVSPGKSIAKIIEVIALNHMLKVYGYNSAEVMNERLQEDMERKKKIRSYLESDKE